MKDKTCIEIVGDPPYDRPCGVIATKYNEQSKVPFCEEHGGDNPRYEPNQIVFPNGIRAIQVNHEDKCITVILAEGWSMFALPSDSGLGVNIERKPLGDKDYPGVANISVVRMRPRPTVDGLPKGARHGE